MVVSLTPQRESAVASMSPVQTDSPRLTALRQGEILLETRSHTAWGAAVTAQMYLPLQRQQVWSQLVDYPRWQQYFPDVTESRILAIKSAEGLPQGWQEKRLYQAASKSFLFLTAQVEAYLRVVEKAGQRIQFQLEAGSFVDFAADLRLLDDEVSEVSTGTMLTYSVQATPKIPIPSVLIQQAIHFDLPANLRNMRHHLCA